MTAQPIPLDTTGLRLHAQTDELRAAGPAVLVTLPGGLTAWSVTRGDVAKKLLTHQGISKDARAHWPGYQPGRYPWLTSWVDVVSMFTTDGDRQRQLRAMVAPTFAPGGMDQLRPAVEAIVTDLLDRLEDVPPGAEVDLRAAFAYPIPTGVICDLFGVPKTQRPAMLQAIDGVLDTSPATDQAQVRDALLAAMGALLEFKRATPGDDMTSRLLQTQREDPDALTEEELVSTLILMLGAGSETAVALIGHAVRELLAHPDQLVRVLGDPTLWDAVVEETLRKNPPIMYLPMRYAIEDIPLGEGVVVRQGDLVIIGFGAHGRDPGIHTDPDRFDIDRETKDHLAFGFGAHFCLGAPLARLEARVALPALFARFPGLQPTGEPTAPIPSFMANDRKTLPVIPRPLAPTG